MEKGKMSSWGIEPTADIFRRQVTILASFSPHSSTLVQWLRGGMYAQEPSGLSWDRGWTRPTPCAPFAQTPTSHGLDYCTALTVPAHPSILSLSQNCAYGKKRLTVSTIASVSLRLSFNGSTDNIIGTSYRGNYRLLIPRPLSHEATAPTVVPPPRFNILVY